MPSRNTTPSLYGIKHSNRNFADRFYWGKNQFNSSFPVALACYMRDKGIAANYIHVENGMGVGLSDIKIDDVFGTTLPNDEIKFLFESVYTPFAQYVQDSVEKIDVVITNARTGEYIRPLEIKLTTLPDDGTSSLEEENYGSEIVVRSPTMRYVALSMVDSMSAADKRTVRKIFDPACRTIRDWGNLREMIDARDSIIEALKKFNERFYSKQVPLLMQPIWKTIGKEPRLCDQCLDMFVWSNFAITKMILDGVIDERDGGSNKITRPQRAALRLARFLYEFAKTGEVFQSPIYDGMTFDTLNDKEFAVSGRKTNRYMKCQRLLRPAVSKQEIRQIVLGGGQKWLSPERRFDAILFFSEDLFDD